MRATTPSAVFGSGLATKALTEVETARYCEVMSLAVVWTDASPASAAVSARSSNLKRILLPTLFSSSVAILLFSRVSVMISPNTFAKRWNSASSLPTCSRRAAPVVADIDLAIAAFRFSSAALAAVSSSAAPVSV